MTLLIIAPDKILLLPSFLTYLRRQANTRDVVLCDVISQERQFAAITRHLSSTSTCPTAMGPS